MHLYFVSHLNIYALYASHVFYLHPLHATDPAALS